MKVVSIVCIQIHLHFISYLIIVTNENEGHLSPYLHELPIGGETDYINGTE